MFCACGIMCAGDIFFLDETLSQVWAFLVKMFREFPQHFNFLQKYYIGYDTACQLKAYCDNQLTPLFEFNYL